MPLTAYISETQEAGGWLTGRFSGSLQDGPLLRESFEDLTLEEALAWAHARTASIIIRRGDAPGPFSAGRQPVAGLPFWPPADLPPLGRRRL